MEQPTGYVLGDRICLMATNDFADWLEAELTERGWAQTFLAERARISDTQLSRLMRRERQPGIDAITGIAKAFGMPIDVVMRKAGWLPDHGDLLPELAALGARLRALSPEQREAALAALEAALRVAEAGDRGRRAR